ncbi:GNAT family N-acetyltransferase [Streptomyces adelaidensis]|uniref:GNAT family N-acetyltransferase n=1 Tax=Streptomyces adelaidensis TaxID=2796465 RepID=UPI0019043585|nr:GNAT family N-acetyltransferase [Streptomyces adelaidensis]
MTAIGDGWVLRPVDEPLGARRSAANGYTASPGDGAGPEEFLVRVQHVRHHPLRACYPYGAHDLVVRLDERGDRAGRGPLHGSESASALLRALVPALFAADARCRRVVAAPDEHDLEAQRVLAAGGLRRITEADLPDGSVVLFAVEPPDIAELSTALDDMPH